MSNDNIVGKKVYHNKYLGGVILDKNADGEVIVKFEDGKQRVFDFQKALENGSLTFIKELQNQPVVVSDSAYDNKISLTKLAQKNNLLRDDLEMFLINKGLINNIRTITQKGRDYGIEYRHGKYGGVWPVYGKEIQKIINNEYYYTPNNNYENVSEKEITVNKTYQNLDDTDDENIKIEEQKALDNIYKRIDDYIDELNSKIEKSRLGIENNKGINTDLDFDVAGSRVEIKKNNNIINELNKIVDNPYNTHIKYNYNDEDEEDIFLGEDDVFTNKKIIFDWKTPIGNAFMDARINHKEKFTMDNAKEKGVYEIVSDRIVDIKDKRIESVKLPHHGSKNVNSQEMNEYVDSYLLDLLNDRRVNKISSSLINTISKEQFNIVKNFDNGNIIVQGCAGSGKSAVMLHKMANYLHNHKTDSNDPIKYLKIITPSPYLQALYSDLSKILHLNEVEYCTIEEYYVKILKNYNKDFEIKTKIIDEKKLNEEIVSYIYKEGWEELKKYIEQDLIDLNVNQFINGESIGNSWRETHSIITAKILDELFLDDRTSQDNGRELLAFFREYIRGECAEYNRNDLSNKRYIDKIYDYLLNVKEPSKVDKIKKVASTIDATSIKDSIIKINDFEKEILNDYTNKVLKNSYELKIEFGVNAADDNNVQYEKAIRISNIISNFNVENLIYNKDFLINDIVKNKDVVEALNKIELYKNFDDNSIIRIMDDLLKDNKDYNSSKKEYFRTLLMIYIKTDFLFLIEYAVEKFLKNIYEYFDSQYENHIYRYKLFLYLNLAYEYYGSKNYDKYISIDEAQDYSSNEINLLKLVLGNNCNIDIFGDLNQAIQNYRYIKSWNELNFVNNDDVYSLNYSYRNTEEIIDFTNNKTQMSIKPLPIHDEKVRVFNSFDNALDEFYDHMVNNNNPDDKSKQTHAIIVSKETDMDELKEKIKSILLIDYLDEFSFESVDFEKISVIDVFTAKGLEFSSVMVVDDGLSKNQLYVALTRAEKSLFYCNIVIEKSEEKKDQLSRIIDIMRKYDKPISYNQLYKEYEIVTGKNVSYGIKGGIRKNIEIHSSDSKCYDAKEEDIFYKSGRGLWGLRNK